MKSEDLILHPAVMFRLTLMIDFLQDLHLIVDPSLKVWLMIGKLESPFLIVPKNKKALSGDTKDTRSARAWVPARAFQSAT